MVTSAFFTVIFCSRVAHIIIYFGFKNIRDESGPDALAAFGCAKGSNEEAYLLQKLVETGFGINNIDHCTRVCHASSVNALLEGIGSGAVSNPFTDVTDADVIFLIGEKTFISSRIGPKKQFITE